MRRFMHGYDCVLEDRQTSFVPEVGATVWLRYRPWIVERALCGDAGDEVLVLVDPARAKPVALVAAQEAP